MKTKKSLFTSIGFAHTKNYKAAANFVTGSIKSYLNENAININNFSINEERIAALIALVDDGKVSNTIATQKVFVSMLNNGDSPDVIAKANNWIQESDNITLQEWIDAAVAKYPEKVQNIKKVKKVLLAYLWEK